MTEDLDLSSVQKLLENEHVPQEFYSIGGLGSGECVGISNGQGRWETYFSEHGEKGSVRYHKTEAEACGRFLQLLDKLLEEYGVKRATLSEIVLGKSQLSRSH